MYMRPDYTTIRAVQEGNKVPKGALPVPLEVTFPTDQVHGADSVGNHVMGHVAQTFTLSAKDGGIFAGMELDDPVARIREAHGGWHLVLPGQWWERFGRYPGAYQAAVRLLSKQFNAGEGLVRMSLARIDWAADFPLVEAGERYAAFITGVEGATVADVPFYKVPTLARLVVDDAHETVKQRWLEAMPHRAFAEAMHAQVGYTRELGVRGKDPEGMRSRSPFVRCYWHPKRMATYRVEVEVKRIPGDTYEEQWAASATLAARLSGVECRTDAKLVSDGAMRVSKPRATDAQRFARLVGLYVGSATRQGEVLDDTSDGVCAVRLLGEAMALDQAVIDRVLRAALDKQFN